MRWRQEAIWLQTPDDYARRDVLRTRECPNRLSVEAPGPDKYLVVGLFDEQVSSEPLRGALRIVEHVSTLGNIHKVPAFLVDHVTTFMEETEPELIVSLVPETELDQRFRRRNPPSGAARALS